MAKEKEVESKLLIVGELPKQELREITSDDGTVYKLMLPDEAIQEILEKVREIHKAV